MIQQIRPDLHVEFGPIETDQTFVLRGDDALVEKTRQAIAECGLDAKVTKWGQGRSELRLHMNETTPGDAMVCSLRVLNPTPTGRAVGIVHNFRRD